MKRWECVMRVWPMRRCISTTSVRRDNCWKDGHGSGELSSWADLYRRAWLDQREVQHRIMRERMYRLISDLGIKAGEGICGCGGVDLGVVLNAFMVKSHTKLTLWIISWRAEIRMRMRLLLGRRSTG